MSRSRGTKPLSKRSKKELDAMAAEFDQEFIADTFGPPPPEVRTRLARIRRRGRPTKGAGSKAISVTVDMTLLQRVDNLAARRKTTRAQLIAEGLKKVLGTARAKSPA